MALGVVLSVLVLCGGCGGPTVDASSEETFKKSVEDMASKMDAAKAERFRKAVGSLMMGKVVFAGRIKDQASAAAKVKEVFHGKTADEIIAEGEKAYAEQKAKIENMTKQ
jgi:hypothetical protein